MNKIQDKPNDKGKASATLANQNSDNKNLSKSGNSGTSRNTYVSTSLISTQKPASTPMLKLRKDGRLT